MLPALRALAAVPLAVVVVVAEVAMAAVAVALVLERFVSTPVILIQSSKLTTVAQEGAGEKKEGEATEGAVATTTEAAATDAAATTKEVQPLTDITNKKINTDEDSKTSAQAANQQQRQRRERGPPADGIPSKTKVMVANLPYDLTEEKVCRDSPMSYDAFD